MKLVHVYVRRTLSFEDIVLKICTRNSLPKNCPKLNDRNQLFTNIAIGYCLRHWCNLWRNCSNQITIAYSCKKNSTIGIEWL